MSIRIGAVSLVVTTLLTITHTGSLTSLEVRAAATGSSDSTSPAVLFTREQLIDDAQQLAEIIANVHPDPYFRGGGRIAYYRRLHRILEAIPTEGLTREQFVRLIRPFVAAVGDGHTQLVDAYRVDGTHPGGIPLKFEVVGESLYVEAVPTEDEKELLGSLLVSVEGVPLADLRERQGRWRGIENQFHGLHILAEETLWHGPYLSDLVPEWVDTSAVSVQLRMPSGEIREFEWELPVRIGSMLSSDTQIAVPVCDRSGFCYEFFDSAGQVAYLRIDHMHGYREMYERRQSADGRNYPSATETFRKLVVEMATANTEMLLVDLRENRGGHTVMADILFYFLYGTDTLIAVKSASFAAGGGDVTRVSQHYLGAASRDIAEFGEGHTVPLVNGDYDFTWDFTGAPERFQALLPHASSLLDMFFREMPTFHLEYVSGTHNGHYRPQQIVVLVSAKTFSAGHNTARYFSLAGATLIGNPPGQAAKLFANAIQLGLRHTGVRIAVSTEYYNHFADDSTMAHALYVHHPLTYDMLSSYEFDPHAEVRYALETLRETER